MSAHFRHEGLQGVGFGCAVTVSMSKVHTLYGTNAETMSIGEFIREYATRAEVEMFGLLGDELPC